jgi:hypothetical protein
LHARELAALELIHEERQGLIDDGGRIAVRDAMGHQRLRPS